MVGVRLDGLVSAGKLIWHRIVWLLRDHGMMAISLLDGIYVMCTNFIGRDLDHIVYYWLICVRLILRFDNTEYSLNNTQN